MKKETELKEKIQVTIDSRLNKYDNIVLFPKKVEEAKKNIARTGLPDIVKKNH